MKDAELIALIESEALPVCDLCVESGIGKNSRRNLGHYFLSESNSQRRDHVGRFFLHKLASRLPNGPVRDSVYPVLAESVVNLLGNNLYDYFHDKIQRQVLQAEREKVTYDELMETPPARRIMEELISKYWIEMQKTPSFQDQLLNKIDHALVKFQSRNPEKDLDIEGFVQTIFQDFTLALRAYV